MSNQNFVIAKQIIRNGFRNKIIFAQLREELPGWRKRQLQSLIFDLMAEPNMTSVPYPGLLKSQAYQKTY